MLMFLPGFIYLKYKKKKRKCTIDVHWCSGKVKVLHILSLCFQHPMRMRHIAICGLSGSTLFSHIVSKRQDFLKRKERFIQNNCFFSGLPSSQ
jgi:hypothetical protein